MSATLETLAAMVPHDPSFYAGAMLIGAYQASRFSEIGRADSIAGRYTTALGGVRLRDFTGTRTYALGVTGFVLASLLIYLFFYRFPTVLAGLGKVTQIAIPGDILADSSTYPLYIAMLFVGIEKLRVPVLSDFFDQLRIFFQDQTDAPQGLNREIDSWLTTITRRSGTSKERLIKEIDTLTDPRWDEFRRYGDTTFFEDRLKKIQAGHDLRQMSRHELLALLEPVLTLVAVALMRRSGPMFEIVRTRISTPPAPGNAANASTADIGRLFTGMFLFALACLVIWQAVAGLDGAMPLITGKSAADDYWPDNSYHSMIVVIARVPLTLMPLILAIYLWRRTHATRPPITDTERLNILSPSGLLDNLADYAAILAACLVLGMALNVLDLLNGYGMYSPPEHIGEGFVQRKAALMFLQALIPLPACYATLVMLENAKAGRAAPLLPPLVFIAVGVLLAAFIQSKTLLEFEMLVNAPLKRPGHEFILLTIFASLTMFVSAFLCVAIYVRRPQRNLPAILPEPVAARSTDPALHIVLPVMPPAPPPGRDRSRDASHAK